MLFDAFDTSSKLLSKFFVCFFIFGGDLFIFIQDFDFDLVFFRFFPEFFFDLFVPSV